VDQLKKGELMDGIVTIVDGKLKIDSRVFEHHELLEAKMFIQKSNFDNLNFIATSENDVDLLNEITIKMEELSPEAADSNIQSFYIN